MDTDQRKETHKHPSSSLNVTEDDIDEVMGLDGNGDFEPSETILNSQNLVEKDSYIKRIQTQLDEEIMRELEEEAKMFEAIKVSKGYRMMILEESFQKKSEENRSISEVFKTELIPKHEDMFESGLIIVDSGVEDISTIYDSVCERTENNFHTEIVNEKNIMDYIDDAGNITQHSIDYNSDGYLMSNWLVKEMLENLCKKQFEKVVKNNNPHTSTSTQIVQDADVSNNNEETTEICIKSKRKLQTTRKSITIKNSKFQNNAVDAGETDMKSKTNLKKNTFVIKKQKYQEPISKNIVDMNSTIKSKEKNNYVVLNKQETKTANNYNYMQKGNVNGAQTSIVNTITAKFKCNECGKQFSTKDMQSDHMHKCIKPKILVNASQLKNIDMLNSFMSETYNCDICTFKTNRKHSIETHLKMHSITNVLSCDICEYKCASKSTLKVHIRTHTDEKPFCCNICQYRCSFRSTLKNHIRTHTGEKPFSCNICEYRCALKSHLTLHKKTHTGEKPFCCDICEYRCSQKSHLERHKRTHTGEKPYACNVCEYRCSHKIHLMYHIRTHTGEKPFFCNICEYRSTRRDDLKKHIRTHTGEKPFVCNICEYRCSKKSHLKDHIRTHTGEKPFCCNICEYRCSQKSHLKKHIKKHR